MIKAYKQGFYFEGQSFLSEGWGVKERFEETESKQAFTLKFKEEIKNFKFDLEKQEDLMEELQIAHQEHVQA